jgi:hypothetical protein
LPVPDKKKTCQRQNKKSRQLNGDLEKWMVWKGAASVHGRIEVEIAWDTIRWALCDNRNAGRKNADDYKQDEIFFSDIHKLRSIVSTVFRDLFKSFSFIPTLWHKSKDFMKFGDIYVQSLLLPVSSGFWSRSSGKIILRES